MLVNDDPGDQAVFVRALGDVTPETLCFTAVDGRDALFMMTNENIIPDYIFVELNMPRLDGIDFLREIRKLADLRDIPVVVHTLYPSQQKINEIREAGAFAIYLDEYHYLGICNLLRLYLTPGGILRISPN